jgi:hypothetical protein
LAQEAAVVAVMAIGMLLVVLALTSIRLFLVPWVQQAVVAVVAAATRLYV